VQGGRKFFPKGQKMAFEALVLSEKKKILLKRFVVIFSLLAIPIIGGIQVGTTFLHGSIFSGVAVITGVVVGGSLMTTYVLLNMPTFVKGGG